MPGPYTANAFTLAPASPQAAAISNLFVGTLVFLSAILILVSFLVIYAIIRYRDRPGAPEPEQKFGSRKLEITWTLVPILSMVVLFGFTMRAMIAGDPPTAEAKPDLRIVAHQWWWEIIYLKSGVTTANEIHIPVGKQLLVDFRSADVIHDFWVPALGRKIDIIPGHPNRLWIEADHGGTYLGACAEFCGNEHAWMRIMVIADSPDDFAAWVKQQAGVPPIPSRRMSSSARRFTAKTSAPTATCGALARISRTSRAAGRSRRARSRTRVKTSPRGCAIPTTSSPAATCRTSS